MSERKMLLHLVLLCNCVSAGLGLTPYLRTVHQSLPSAHHNTDKVHVILGTEACDLDSAVSSIVMGYLLAADSKHFVVPMLNILRADYYLKSEVEFVFNKHNITEDMVNFLDDIDLFGLYEQNKLEITLVDHNVVSRYLKPLQDSVVRVIDHHKWEANFSSNIDRKVETVGSCTTLVGEKLLDEHPELVDRPIASLIMMSILIDTSNFKESKNKTTPKDLAIYSKLERWNPDVDRKKEYKAISDAKQAIGNFSVFNLLRKDLKTAYTELLNIPVPAIPTTLDNFIQMKDFKKDLELFRQLEKAQAVVALTKLGGDSRTTDGLYKGITLYSMDSKFLAELVDFLMKFDQGSLKLKKMDEQHDLYALDPTIINLLQKNITASRKAVLPAVRDFLTQYKHLN